MWHAVRRCRPGHARPAAAALQVMYEQKLAHTRGLAASIASGLAKMNEAKLDVNRMKVGR